MLYLVRGKNLKKAMRDRFVPPYHRDLHKKLMRCSAVEGNEDSICRFYSGLRSKIQDIVDYKEFNTVNQLF